MNTDALIARLAAEATPMAPTTPRRRMAAGIAIGAASGAAVVLAMIGPRPDLGEAMTTAMFWTKLAYSGSIALIALSAALWLGRPESRGLKRLWPLLLPVLLLTALAGGELATTPQAQWRALLMGSSALRCPWNVLALAIPVHAGLVWAFRRLAPTRLGEAGLAAGIGAGGVAASVYGLHCPESAALFVLCWYTLGIVLAGAIGAATGRLLLRW